MGRGKEVKGILGLSVTFFGRWRCNTCPTINDFSVDRLYTLRKSLVLKKQDIDYNADNILQCTVDAVVVAHDVTKYKQKPYREFKHPRHLKNLSAR